jgi:L-ascorbate 6-phosphate lactonase
MNERTNVVPAIEAHEVSSGLRLWWLGGPSYAIKSPRTLVYVDPYHSGDRTDDPQGFVRAIPNYFYPQTVTRADVVISTQDLVDHCDPDTLRPLYARTAARFAAAPSSTHMMATWGFEAARVQAMAPGTTMTVGDITLTAYPANDWEDEDAVTLMLESGGVGIFIGGDTLSFDGLDEIGRAHAVDLAVLALGRNRRDIIDAQLYADPVEIARAARALRARKVLPVHWEIWREWVEDPHKTSTYACNPGPPQMFRLRERMALSSGHAMEQAPVQGAAGRFELAVGEAAGGREGAQELRVEAAVAVLPW